MITKEEFAEIMDSDSPIDTGSGCRVLRGLMVITKYLPLEGIGAADHDIVFSCGADEIVEAGITKEDAMRLRDLNWMIDEDSLAHFV